MADVPSQGAMAKAAVDDAVPFDGSSVSIEILSESVRRIDTHLDTNGMRGSKDMSADRVRLARSAISGSLSMNPDAAEVDWFIEKILGGTTAVGVTAVADTLPYWQLMVDRIAKVYTYTDLVVGQATISGSAGDMLTLALDVEGESEVVGSAGAFAGGALSAGNTYVMSDVTLTLGGTVYPCSQFSLVINNNLDADRYNNSLSRSAIVSAGRLVTLSANLPFTPDTAALHAMAIGGVAGILAWTDGSDVYTFTMPNVKAPSNTPVASGKSEIRWDLAMTARETGGVASILCTKT